MAEPIKLGLWGGSGGDFFDIGGQQPARLVKIIISSADTIDSLAFDYVEDGTPKTAGPWGGTGGTSRTLDLDSDEYLVNVSGTTGRFQGNANVVRSLRFVTNKRSWGPFGQEQGTPFSVPVASGQIVAFYGRFGWYADAIGMYLIPAP